MIDAVLHIAHRLVGGVSLEIDVDSLQGLAHVVFVYLHAGSDPEVAELRRQHAEVSSREVEVLFTMALLLEKHKRMEVHQDQQQPKWEV
jgi:hypothetical protein